MHPAGVEPSIPASKGPKTYALDRVATGIGQIPTYLLFTVLFNTHSTSTPAPQWAHIEGLGFIELIDKCIDNYWKRKSVH